jgi:predicted ester cyclase
MLIQRERKIKEFLSALKSQRKRLLEKIPTLQFTLLLLVADVAAVAAAD